MVLSGPELNSRVWRLFSKAGFETIPNETDDSEENVTLLGGAMRPIDLFAEVKSLNISVIGQHSGERRIQSKSSYINDTAQLKRAKSADAGLIVWTNQSIDATDVKAAASEGIKLWGQSELEYFEAVADAIGEYAKYEIIHALGIQTTEQADTHKTLAFRFKQSRTLQDAELFLFTVTPEQLLKTCVIYRRAQGDGAAYQRMLQKSRLPQIRKFVSNTQAVLPTNVIVHLNDSVLWDPINLGTPKDLKDRPIRLSRPDDTEVGVLSIPLAYASLELIDGQHRLFGFVDTPADVRQNFNLAIVGVRGLLPTAKRDMFVSINDKSRRMDANLVAYLKYTEDEEECQKTPELMAIKIAVALNHDSALKGRIKLLDMGRMPITLKGISGYELRSLVSPRGLLKRSVGPDSASYIHVLRMYFSILKSTFPSEWADPSTYILSTNRGISAFLKLLKSMLSTSEHPLGATDFHRYLDALKNSWPSDDWKIKQLRGRYIGTAGWNDFHTDLVSAIRRTIPDFAS